MANCEFLGFENVRGTLSKQTYVDRNGQKHTKSVVACVRGGKQRIYLRGDYERSTPVSDKEKAARNLFAERASLVKKLIQQGYPKKEAWTIAKQQIPS